MQEWFYSNRSELIHSAARLLVIGTRASPAWGDVALIETPCLKDADPPGG